MSLAVTLIAMNRRLLLQEQVTSWSECQDLESGDKSLYQYHLTRVRDDGCKSDFFKTKIAIHPG